MSHLGGRMEILMLHRILACFLCCLLFLTLLSPTLSAAMPAQMQEEHYAYGDFILPYRIYLPAGYTKENSYPLMLFFHGAGERGTDFAWLICDTVTKWTEGPDAPLADAIVLTPHCPPDMQWACTPWYQSYDAETDPPSLAMEATMSLLDKVIGYYAVDTDRLYVAGYSMGGYATWDVLIRYGDRFAGGMPICGFGDASQAERIKDIPIIALHGAEDDVVPVSGSRDIVEALQDMGSMNLTYIELPGRGHDVWLDAGDDRTWIDQLLRYRLSDRAHLTADTADSTDDSGDPADASADPADADTDKAPGIPVWQFLAAAAFAAVISTVAVEMKRRTKPFKKGKKEKK